VNLAPAALDRCGRLVYDEACGFEACDEGACEVCGGRVVFGVKEAFDQFDGAVTRVRCLGAHGSLQTMPW